MKRDQRWWAVIIIPGIFLTLWWLSGIKGVVAFGIAFLVSMGIMIGISKLKTREEVFKRIEPLLWGIFLLSVFLIEWFLLDKHISFTVTAFVLIVIAHIITKVKKPARWTKIIKPIWALMIFTLELIEVCNKYVIPLIFK